MANQNKEIGEIVKKCKILLLDIEGTTTSISFVKDKLFPYVEENVKQFLDSQWDTDDVKESVDALRKQAIEDQDGNVEGVVTIPGEDATKDDQIEGLMKSVQWQMSLDRKAGPLKQLQGLIWKQGYDNGDIKGHVFDDVSVALDQWRSTDGQKVYIYSSGSVQAQKLLFGQSLAGDLLRFIDGHFDTAVGAKQESESYTNIAKKIECSPDDVLFLTDIVKEAEAARAAGMNAALLSREGNAPLPAEAIESFPVLHSLAELTVSNKRKQETQDELPAKIPKTDKEEVKTAVAEKETADTTTDTKESDTENMDVEEETTSSEVTPEKEKTTVTVEEVTDSNEARSDNANATEALPEHAEPIVEHAEEKETKTDDKQTEEMETDTVKPIVEEKLENGDSVSPVVEETAQTVITEIEDVSDKQLTEVADIIDDLVPVVEEPPATAELENLESTGQSLEKECDEILSKVQDVTNLDNIPLKPLLNTIAEETMETDNTDSNDIVDGILDTELEMEMKQSTEIDVNNVEDLGEKEQVAEIKDKDKTVEIIKKDESTEESDKSETRNIETGDVPKDENMETNGITEEKSDESSSTEVNNDQSQNNELKECGMKDKELPADSSVLDTKMELPSKESDIPKEDTKDVADAKAANETSVAEAVAKATENDKTADEIQPVVEVTPAEEVKSVEEAKPVVEVTEEKKHSEDTKDESDVMEPHVNGKTTNGDAVNLNGDASKEDELNSRLSVENGNAVNGDANKTEQGQGDSKVEEEVTDIKVKTVPTDEPRTDPIEQPTEA